MKALLSHPAARLLLGALVLLIIGVWGQDAVSDRIQERLSSDLQALLRADVTALELWMTDQLTVIEVIAAHEPSATIFRDLVAGAHRSATPQELAEAPALATLRERFESLVRAFGYLDLLVFTPEGRVVGALTDAPMGLSDPALRTPAFAKAAAGARVLSRPFPAAVPLPDSAGVLRPGRPTLFTFAPVRDAAGAITAVIGFRIDPEEQFTLILNVARSGETGETYAFDREGLLLSHSRFDGQLREIGLLPDAPESEAILNISVRDPGGDMTRGFVPRVPRHEQPLTRMAAAAVTGGSGVDTQGYRDYRGVPVIGAWSWFPEQGFGVATEVDVAEGYRGLRFLQRIFWVLFGLLVLSAVGFGASTLVIDRLQDRVSEAVRLGQYTLEKKIGEGGMGKVYRARHALLRRPTAIKILDVDRATEKAVARFEREVQMTSQLTHPNTIAIYDFGRTPDGVFYYAMEYLAGLNLSQLVRQFGPLPSGRVVHILSQAAGSLNEAHRMGLIHRDIKPGNIILTERGAVFDVVKVLDFGLVKDIERREDVTLTAKHSVTGTPHYVAPENITDAKSADGRSDLYSLGAVGFFLLTGRHLFEGETAMELLMHHVQTQPTAPSTFAETPVDPKLEALIMQLLSKKPEDRPADAAVLGEALAALECGRDWDGEKAAAWWRAHMEFDPVSGTLSRPTTPETQTAPGVTALDIDLGKRSRGKA